LVDVYQSSFRYKKNVNFISTFEKSASIRQELLILNQDTFSKIEIKLRLFKNGNQINTPLLKVKTIRII